MDIIVKNLNKSFGDQQVIRDFSCRIPEGKTTCIMGDSGCGKTTFLNILLGISQADSGVVEGIPAGSLAAVFQEDRLCENLSAASNLRLVCKRHLSEQEIREAFARVKLEDVWQKPVRELSGGMRRRVAILRALVAEADCIMMDEPLKGLDPETKEKTAGYIKEQAVGKTLIVITHDQSDAPLLGAEDILRL